LRENLKKPKLINSFKRIIVRSGAMW